MSIILNDGQTAALETLDMFMSSDFNQMILSGAAGTGKSTVLTQFIKTWKQFAVIEVCAPMHTALDGLRKLDRRIDCNTLQSFLKLRPHYEAGGRRTFVPSAETGQFRCDLLIIDECGIVSEDLFDILTNHISCKILFVGDRCQLPPVGESLSKVFLAGYPEVKLSEQMRTDIYGELYEKFREAVETEIFPEIDESLIMSKYNKQAVFDEYKNNPDIKLLAHRNSQVSDYNKLIRDTDMEYRVGERMMFIDYYSLNYNKYYTGYEFILDIVVQERKMHPWGKSFEVWSVKFHTVDDPSLRSLIIVSAIDKSYYEEMCNERRKITARDIRGKSAKKKSMMWAEYYELAGLYNPPITYSYSNNVYKAQSHTYQTIRIDVTDIMETAYDCKFKAMYTAVTRGAADIKFIM